MQVSELQRSRMLASAVEVVAKHGYQGMSVSRVTHGAGVSRRTFYDLFKDREDCFLAAFNEVTEQLAVSVRAAYESERAWREQVRAALTVLLGYLDDEPKARALLVVDALKAGPVVLDRRAQLMEQLSDRLHVGGLRAGHGRELPPLTGEGIIGAVLGVIHTRLLGSRQATLLELVNPLMGTIVLPYLGSKAAQEELQRPAPQRVARLAPAQAHADGANANPLAGLPMRITYRTLLALRAIGEQPGASNRQVAKSAGIADQGQISRLLTRLQRLGLVDNTGEGQPSGEPNRWQLTTRGIEVQQTIQNQSASRADRRKAEL